MFLKKSLALCVPLIMSFATVSSVVAQPAQAPVTLVAQGADSSSATTTTTTTTTTSDSDTTSAEFSESMMKNRPYGATPEEAFLKARDNELKIYQTVAENKGTSFGVKALRSICVPLAGAYKIPLKLDSQKIEGDKATVVYKADKPDVDMSITGNMRKNDKGWRLYNKDMEGKYSSVVAQEMVSSFSTQLPGETSMLSLALVLMVVSGIVSFVGSLWLIINGFRKHILWGLGCLFFPIVQLVFVCLNWSLAKKPFFVLLGSIVLFGAGCAIPAYYLASSGSEVSPLLDELNKIN